MVDNINKMMKPFHTHPPRFHIHKPNFPARAKSHEKTCFIFSLFQSAYNQTIVMLNERDSFQLFLRCQLQIGFHN